MRRNAVIVHGKPSPERYFSDTYPGPHRANWLPWLGKKLLEAGYEDVSIPEVPDAFEPSYDKWIGMLDTGVDEGTLLVGHSFGVAALLEYMSRNDNVVAGRLIGVAPWFDPNHRYPQAGLPQINPSIQDRVKEGVDIFYSTEDSEEVLASVGLMLKKFPQAKPHNIPEYGHFLLGNSMNSIEFPEILEVI